MARAAALGDPLDDVVARSAAPDAVRVALDRLASAHPGLIDELRDDMDLAGAVVAVCAASRELTVLLETDAAAVGVLRDLDPRPDPPDGEGEGALRRWKAIEYLRIAGRDLLRMDDLPVTGRRLSELATDVLVEAGRLSDATDLVVVGMGKLGGQELNYASDVDILFVADAAEADPEAAARRVMSVARGCFRVDANLRPEGRDGPLTRTVESYMAYWDRWAQPWEFQALLKARPATGPAEVADAFDEAARSRLWSRSFAADELRSLRALKARSEQEVARRGVAGRELKRGAGGIRDIEFAVQLLQLVHGRHDEALRSPTTLVALAELGDAGYVDPGDAAELAECYRFLRTVEHRLQMVDGQQLHAVPAGAGERERLARVLGYRGTAESSALDAFDHELAHRRATVRAIHERVYFRPLLEAFAGAPVGLRPDAASERLAAFGFTDVDRTRQAVRELTRGLTRASRLMDQLLPLLLGWLADSPDPDQGLLGLRTLASGAQRSRELARAFRESPETARRLCVVLGTSRLLGDTLHRNPDLVHDLGDDAGLAPRSLPQLREEALTALAVRDSASRPAALRRAKDREVWRIATRDVLDLSSVDATATDLTAMAEAVVDAAVAVVEPPVPFAVIAMGRFGGAELSYASDLDVLFVYDGDTADDFEAAERTATRLLRLVSGSTPTERIFALDAGLRPEGRQGPLARSLDGFRTYFERWALVWERQAMLRARPVAGDGDLGQRFLATMAPHVWDRPFTAEDRREVRRIKARVERERIPAGDDPQFHLKLGRGSLTDVEFTVQLLQLAHGVRATGTMEALARLTADGVLVPSDTDVLAAAYRFCERARNRLYLVEGAAGDALPTTPERLSRLARSLDSSPVELREEYRRVTRRARTVVERLFYGRT